VRVDGVHGVDPAAPAPPWHVTQDTVLRRSSTIYRDGTRADQEAHHDTQEAPRAPAIRTPLRRPRPAPVPALPRPRRRGTAGHRRHPGRPPGFGPGFPPGFGPGGPRGRRGRRTSRGDIRLAVLALLAEQPRHGYEIIQEIAERSGGRWRPSPGSVYPTISQLEDEGLVLVEKAEGRRVCRLTEAGTAHVEERRAELDAVWASVQDGGDDEAAGLWEQLAALHAAAQQVGRGPASPDQVTAATAAVTEARKAIYRLLAE
jgi:DNA-binding PadR family transcriptional regulator